MIPAMMKTQPHNTMILSILNSLLVLSLFIPTTCHQSCISEEIEALLRFKHGITADNCGLLDSWGSDHHVDCCRWQGVRCSNRSDTYDHVVNVIGLDLHGFITSDLPEQRCLQGKVSPNSLDKLKQLEYLDLSSNNFQSQPIPSFFGSLVNLKYLNLSQAGFAGELPHQLGNLSALTSLDLNNDGYVADLYANSLSWLSRLTLLSYIDLTGIDLSHATDFFQVVTNLPLLRVLHADSCSLFPPDLRLLSYHNSSTSLSIVTLASNQCNDTSILQWLFNLSLISTSHLEHIDVHDNSISGPIPSYFWNHMHTVSYLDLSNNLFECPVPNTISNLKHLAYLDLSYSFQGSGCQLPNTLANLCSLDTLLLNFIGITGEFSDIIDNLSQCAHKSLAALELRGNLLWGSIPDTIGTFSSLRRLDVSLNRLNGTISQHLGQLSKLETLSLSDNSLQGTFSEHHLSNLSRLSFLHVSDNPTLVTRISSNWIPPFQLDYILMRSTKLGPEFPMWLLTQTNFSYLDMSHGGISDTIPPSFWRSLSSDLRYLNLSNNNIQGELSVDGEFTFDNFDQNIIIDLSSNFIKGTVPSFSRNLSSLFLGNNLFTNATHLLCPSTQMRMLQLDLSNNLLSHELPDCWTRFNELSALSLQNNHFTGNLPKSIGSLRNLKILNLRNTSLIGELPTSLENCRALVILDVGYNSLTGRIPRGVGNKLENIAVLRLRSNSFYGRLPLSLCKLSFLQVLDISGNYLSGTIPDCINNLTAMTKAFDFLYPSNFMFLYTGDTYYFKMYEESATLMWKGMERSFKAKNLGMVKYIDMSDNELQGHIPNEIGSLTGLVLLDLSRNNLTGSITSEISQLSSLELLNLSSNHLDGYIPTSLASMSSLAVLGLSNNNLSGQIPTGTQLQSFSASSYIGNPLLCGSPLPECFEHQASPNAHNKNKQEISTNDKDDDMFLGLCISVALGFIVGFWGVCGTLVLNNSWRFALFHFIDDIKDKVW